MEHGSWRRNQKMLCHHKEQTSMKMEQKENKEAGHGGKRSKEESIQFSWEQTPTWLSNRNPTGDSHTAHTPEPAAVWVPCIFFRLAITVQHRHSKYLLTLLPFCIVMNREWRKGPQICDFVTTPRPWSYSACHAGRGGGWVRERAKRESG